PVGYFELGGPDHGRPDQAQWRHRYIQDWVWREALCPDCPVPPAGAAVRLPGFAGAHARPPALTDWAGWDQSAAKDCWPVLADALRHRPDSAAPRAEDLTVRSRC